MNILDKVGEGLTNTVDLLVEKNRQMAQLNRLSAIIQTETDMINRAYIALGKHYFAMLQGNASDNDMTQICEVIKFSEDRLKKAQARYDYVKVYGVPSAPVDTVDMIRSNEKEETECGEEEKAEEVVESEEENADITIAVADAGEETEETEKTEEETAAVEAENTEEEPTVEETKAEESAETETEEKAEESLKKTIAEKAAETVNQLKQRRKRRFEKDNEAENDD